METPSGGYCDPEARLAGVRPSLHTSHPNFNSQFSLERLRADVGKSSEVLRAWASDEGEDLQVRSLQPRRLDVPTNRGP